MQVEAASWLSVVVRLGTDQDRCEWHASGTAGEDDVRRAWQRGHRLDRRVRLDPRDASLVGKGRRPAAAMVDTAICAA